MPYPRGNAGIALQLLSKFRGLIESISYKMGARYRLSYEDRQDLVNAACAKISTTKWRTVLKRGNYKPLENYCISTIQTSMAKELRRIKAAGLSGLSKGPKIGDFPQYEDNNAVHPGAFSGHDPLDNLVANEYAERAQAILPPQEWSVVRLTFGFDGGASRTAEEVAKELNYTVFLVELLLAQALERLR